MCRFGGVDEDSRLVGAHTLLPAADPVSTVHTFHSMQDCAGCYGSVIWRPGLAWQPLGMCQQVLVRVQLLVCCCLHAGVCMLLLSVQKLSGPGHAVHVTLVDAVGIGAGGSGAAAGLLHPFTPRGKVWMQCSSTPAMQADCTDSFAVHGTYVCEDAALQQSFPLLPFAC